YRFNIARLFADVLKQTDYETNLFNINTFFNPFN
ncbi:MAG: hypothetical protein K0S53_2829, partial [Bacteroidetes bacterium]|nr:hypothetical protein [Bacteroidota bacterium]